jgi:hypothetical protein
LQLCMNSNHLGVVLIIYDKRMHLIIHFNQGATWLFLHPSFLTVLFNILTEMPLASNNIDA